VQKRFRLQHSDCVMCRCSSSRCIWDGYVSLARRSYASPTSSHRNFKKWTAG